MKQHIQTTLLGFAILLILSSLVVNAETAKTTTSEVRYRYYYREDSFTKRYHRFFSNPASKDFHYYTRMDTTANVDDTPETENIALVVIDTKQGADFGNWHQAFLLITNTKARKPEKKALFKLFDTGTYASEVPAAKAIALHNSPFVFTEPINVSFRLVDLTGDGTLDIWVESEHGVALISFENGEFKEVFSSHTVTREKFTETPEFEYHYYYDNLFIPAGQKYHRFLGAPPPEGLRYTAVMKVIANIDNTPEKESIVLMIAHGGEEWVQGFLLITDTQADGSPKKKELFKLFDAGTHHFDVPGKTIEFQSAPFVFREWFRRRAWGFINATHFRLVDLTGDGILDVWVKCAYGVAVISFQNSEFKAVCGAYSSTRREDPIEYIDLDNDGIYEIRIPDRIGISGVPGAVSPQWMSLYKWDGNTYVLDNERFYADNDEFLIGLLNLYNHVLIRHGRFDEYSFRIGLVFYYRGDVPMAQKYLQWVAKSAENDRYIHAAEELLKKLPHH